MTNTVKYFQLPDEEYNQVQLTENNTSCATHGFVNYDSQNVLLIFGDLSSVSVPFKFFKDDNKYAPDFSQPSITDCGQTICFGDYRDPKIYEIGLDVILKHNKKLNTINVI